ncbi:MAG: hypothetical protein AAFO51_02825 [Pseudomonadota bacterium]
MLHPSTKRLIDKLAEMTEKRLIPWSDTDSGAVSYDAEGYRVDLTDDGEVIVRDPQGKELERASADDLAASESEAGGVYSDVVSGIRSEAVRIARGTEAAIDKLLAGLDAVAAEPAATSGKDPGESDGVQTDETAVATEKTLDTSDVETAVKKMADTVNGATQAKPAPIPEPEAPTPPPATPAAPTSTKQAVAPAPQDIKPTEATPPKPVAPAKKPSLNGGFSSFGAGGLAAPRPAQPSPVAAPPPPATEERVKPVIDDVAETAPPAAPAAPTPDVAPQPAPAPKTPTAQGFSGFGNYGFASAASAKPATPAVQPPTETPEQDTAPASEEQAAEPGAGDAPAPTTAEPAMQAEPAPSAPPTEDPQSDAAIAEANALLEEPLGEPSSAQPETDLIDTEGAFESAEDPSGDEQDPDAPTEGEVRPTTRFNPWN